MRTKTFVGRICCARPFLPAAAVLLSAASFAAGTWTPDLRAISALEAQIRTPAGAPEPIGPMADYARFYVGVTIGGRRMIRGELVHAPRECPQPVRDVGVFCAYQAGIHLNEEFPSILDGGCGIVNLLYDPAARRIVWIRCNGVA